MELEVIAFDLASCLLAENCGADRIELCANPNEGGTTPSIGMISVARKKTSIQLFPIIRPRGGDFLYSDEELDAMESDIKNCETLECDGVVIGCLTENGDIDMKQCERLMKAAGKMQVTFHRAFDRTNDPFKALEKIIELGCKRILTSGLHPDVDKGKDMLKKLVQAANGRIKIMPGSGVRSTNLKSLAEHTGATAFHSSARRNIMTNMKYMNPDMHEQLTSVTIDPVEVQKLRTILNEMSNIQG